jgi:hypothetical protein
MKIGGQIVREWTAASQDWEDDFLMVDDFTKKEKGKFNPK